jgi:hypothetical protein
MNSYRSFSKVTLITILNLNLTTALQVHCIYRIIHKSFRDVRPLRHTSRDGHAEGEHVNRGTDTASFCPNLTGARYVLSAVSVLVVAQPSSEVPEGLINYPVFSNHRCA